ncbi:ran-binding protein m [Anaeramoeba ignava]|uniref:Ran-binding protein m n=1 Tax=Anaeramoeba ignava TaxID=1746090 RepID=A0A9Q0RBN5_ANAIG|nr:ran-binding protein m [Anaeramoeba ignava]
MKLKLKLKFIYKIKIKFNIEKQFTVITVLVAIFAVLFAALKYLYQLHSQSKQNPLIIAPVLLIGAWYVCFAIWSLLESFDSNAFNESILKYSLSFAVVFLFFGPFVIFCPTRPIKIDKDKLFQAVKAGQDAPKKKKNILGMIVLFFIVILQGFIFYAIFYSTYYVFEVNIALVIGSIAGYLFAMIIYLVFFASVLLDKDIYIKGANMMDELRGKLIINRINAEPLNILASGFYSKIYLILFFPLTCVILYMLLRIFIVDMNKFSDLATGAKSISIIFFSIILLITIYLIVRIIHFGIKKVRVYSEVQLEDGKIINLNTIKYISVVRSFDRITLCSYGSRSDPLIPKFTQIVASRQKVTPTTPGFFSRLPIDHLWCLIQENDYFSMFFVVTGNSYEMNTSRHLISQIQNFFQNTFYEEVAEISFPKQKVKRNSDGYFQLEYKQTPYNLYPPFGLNYQVYEFFMHLSRKYSDPTQYSSLVKDAEKWFNENANLQLDYKNYYQTQDNELAKVDENQKEIIVDLEEKLSKLSTSIEQEKQDPEFKPPDSTEKRKSIPNEEMKEFEQLFHRPIKQFEPVVDPKNKPNENDPLIPDQAPKPIVKPKGKKKTKEEKLIEKQKKLEEEKIQKQKIKKSQEIERKQFLQQKEHELKIQKEQQMSERLKQRREFQESLITTSFKDFDGDFEPIIFEDEDDLDENEKTKDDLDENDLDKEKEKEIQIESESESEKEPKIDKLKLSDPQDRFAIDELIKRVEALEPHLNSLKMIKIDRKDLSPDLKITEIKPNEYEIILKPKTPPMIQQIEPQPTEFAFEEPPKIPKNKKLQEPPKRPKITSENVPFSLAQQIIVPRPEKLHKNKHKNHYQISDDRREVQYTMVRGEGVNDYDLGVIFRGNLHVADPLPVYYFETKIVSGGERGEIAIGFYPTEKGKEPIGMPGWLNGSYGYHGDDGSKFCEADGGEGEMFSEPFGKNDVIGCGWNITYGIIFYTKNGRILGNAFTNVKNKKGFYPVVGLLSVGASVRVNFGQEPFLFNKFESLVPKIENILIFFDVQQRDYEEKQKEYEKLLSLMFPSQMDKFEKRIQSWVKSQSAIWQDNATKWILWFSSQLSQYLDKDGLKQFTKFHKQNFLVFSSQWKDQMAMHMRDIRDQRITILDRDQWVFSIKNTLYFFHNNWKMQINNHFSQIKSQSQQELFSWKSFTTRTPAPEHSLFVVEMQILLTSENKKSSENYKLFLESTQQANTGEQEQLNPEIAIGFVPEEYYFPNTTPGSTLFSTGYYSSDGSKKNAGVKTAFAEKFSFGDTISACIDTNTNTIMFAKNGHYVGTAARWWEKSIHKTDQEEISLDDDENQQPHKDQNNENNNNNSNSAEENTNDQDPNNLQSHAPQSTIPPDLSFLPVVAILTPDIKIRIKFNDFLSFPKAFGEYRLTPFISYDAYSLYKELYSVVLKPYLEKFQDGQPWRYELNPFIFQLFDVGIHHLFNLFSKFDRLISIQLSGKFPLEPESQLLILDWIKLSKTAIRQKSTELRLSQFLHLPLDKLRDSAGNTNENSIVSLVDTFRTFDSLFSVFEWISFPKFHQAIGFIFESLENSIRKDLPFFSDNESGLFLFKDFCLVFYENLIKMMNPKEIPEVQSLIKQNKKKHVKIN